MAERPILFNTEMVRAILEDRKTQTRRLVKGLPLAEPWFTVEDGKPMMCDENGEWYPAERFSVVQPGDILWVRETWAKDVGRYMYRANYSDTEKFYMNGREIRMVWSPSIHMPRKAARLFLLVKDVRCERLQDMTVEDCALDGGFCMDAVKVIGVERLFGKLWDSTIKKADIPCYGWDANPWLWVIEFERINPQNQ
jgi:hypothetical protein